MQETFLSVTVRGGGQVVELPLPAAAPIAELTPALVRLCHGGRVQASREATPAAWALARPGGRALPLTASLEEAGLRDGDVLHLVDVSTWDAPARSSLAGVVGAAVGLGPRWTGTATARLFSFASAAATLVALAGLLWPGLVVLPDTVAAPAGGPEVVAGTVAVVGSAALGLRLLPRLVAALAALPWPGARRSRRLLSALSWGTAAAVLGAVVLLLVAGRPLFVVLGVVVAAGLAQAARGLRLTADVLPLAVVAGAAPAALALGLTVRLEAAARPLAAVAVLGGTGLALLGGAVALTWRAGKG